MKAGLVIVDIQNDYFEGGKNPLVGSKEAAKQAKKLLEYFRANELPVFFVQHISLSQDAKFFAPDTIGAKIYDEIFPKEQEEVIVKHAPDSFYQTNLKECLEKEAVSQLVVCGMMTHMCIDTTVRAARNFGYEVTLIEDACATKDLVWNQNRVPAAVVQNAFLAALDGSFATIKTTDLWLEER